MGYGPELLVHISLLASSWRLVAYSPEELNSIILSLRLSSPRGVRRLLYYEQRKGRPEA